MPDWGPPVTATCPCGDLEVQFPGAAPLACGVVEDAERDPHEGALALAEPESARGDGERSGGGVEGDRVGQRREPDAAYGRGGRGELVDDDAEDAGAGLAGGGGGLLLGVLGGTGGVLEGVEGGVGQGEGPVRGAVAVPGGAPVAAGDVTGLEAGIGGGVHLEVAEAGQRGQLEGVGGVEDGARLVGGEGAQAEPVRQVGVEALELAALDALAGQQQVHADGAADAADGQEQVDEVGFGGEEFAELVDDDEQVGQRLQFGVLGAQDGVVADVGDVVGVLEDLLAALDLAREAGVDALDESGLVLQVGDDPGDVRELLEGGEGRAALVVDEDHREVLGRVRGDQREDERT